MKKLLIILTVFAANFLLMSCAAIINVRKRPSWSFNYYEKDARYLYFHGKSGEKKIEQTNIAKVEAEEKARKKASGYFENWLKLKLVELKYKYPHLGDHLNIDNILKRAVIIFKEDITKFRTDKKKIIKDKKKKYVFVFVKQKVKIIYLHESKRKAIDERVLFLKDELAALLDDPRKKEKLLESIKVLTHFRK